MLCCAVVTDLRCIRNVDGNVVGIDDIVIFVDVGVSYSSAYCTSSYDCTGRYCHVRRGFFVSASAVVGVATNIGVIYSRGMAIYCTARCCTVLCCATSGVMRGVMPIVDVSIATVDGVVRTVVALSHERRCMHYCTVLHCTVLRRKVMHCAPHHSPLFVYCTVLCCTVQYSMDALHI